MRTYILCLNNIICNYIRQKRLRLSSIYYDVYYSVKLISKTNRAYKAHRAERIKRFNLHIIMSVRTYIGRFKKCVL